jgi:hypothetical protein
MVNEQQVKSLEVVSRRIDWSDITGEPASSLKLDGMSTEQVSEVIQKEIIARGDVSAPRMEGITSEISVPKNVRLDWSSGAVFKGVEAIISEKRLSWIPKNKIERDEWQGRTYRLFSKEMKKSRGSDLVVLHNSKLGLIVMGFSQSVNFDDQEEIFTRMRQECGEAIYNEERMIAPKKGSLIHLFAFGEESDLPRVADQFKLIFPLIYPGNFQRQTITK